MAVYQPTGSIDNFLLKKKGKLRENNLLGSFDMETWKIIIFIVIFILCA